jgi:hypothetical protein
VNNFSSTGNNRLTEKDNQAYCSLFNQYPRQLGLAASFREEFSSVIHTYTNTHIHIRVLTTRHLLVTRKLDFLSHLIDDKVNSKTKTKTELGASGLHL